MVTGAFGYTGRHVAARLLDAGKLVRTLTGHPGRPNPFGGRIEVAPFDWVRPRSLARSLEGASVLYNTYWVRFDHDGVTFETAVENSRKLIDAAARAGVGRIVHVSITNPSEDSPFPYFRGKAAVERAVAESGLPYAIVRPTVVFGRGDVLVNNVAWLLRRFPVFAVPGWGGCPIQPVSVDDVADLCVECGEAAGDSVLDAAGPETFAFAEMVRVIARAVGSRARVLPVPPAVALALSRAVSALVRDVLLTQDEMEGLMAGLVASSEPPRGRVRFTGWVAAHADELGRFYASELTRHYRRPASDRLRRSPAP